MMRGGSELEDRSAVLAGRIPDVGLPAISPIAPGERAHDAIARDLGDDRGRRDRKAEPISLHDGLHGTGERRRDVAVYEGHVGVNPEGGDRPRHRQQRSAQDIDAVDFTRARRTKADMRDAAPDASPDCPPARLALLGGQHLRIVEPLVQGPGEATRVEDYGGGHDRPSERPAPGLVDAADDPRRAPLNREIRHRPSVRRLLPRARGTEQANCRSRHRAATKRRYVDRMLQFGRRFPGPAVLACRATTLLLAAVAVWLLA